MSAPLAVMNDTQATYGNGKYINGLLILSSGETGACIQAEICYWEGR